MYIYPRLTINIEHQSNRILVVSVHPVYRKRPVSVWAAVRQWGDYASCVFLSSTKHIKKVSNTKKRKIIFLNIRSPSLSLIYSRQSLESNAAKQQATCKACNVARSDRPNNTESGIGFEPQTMQVVMLTVNINWIELYPMSFTDHWQLLFQQNV